MTLVENQMSAPTRTSKMKKTVTKNISRRRMIAISASFTGAAVVSLNPSLALSKTLNKSKPVTWHGTALGAQAQITLTHNDSNAAKNILNSCREEISRLEHLFSLYQPQSAICQLNHAGELNNPAPEMLELVSNSLTISSQTNGAFDITVQPLWQLYANHFSKASAKQSGPDTLQVNQALGHVDYRQLEVSTQRIHFKKDGMGITLNGIAQGYITDKISSLLRAAGYTNVLVYLGETYAMGRKSPSQPWIAGIQDPENQKNILKTFALENLALATSGGYGTTFSTTGEHHHLFDPRTGHSTNRYRSVSVIAPDAMSADALSTAFSSMSLHEIRKVIERRQNVRATIVQSNNQVLEL